MNKSKYDKYCFYFFIVDLVLGLENGPGGSGPFFH